MSEAAWAWAAWSPRLTDLSLPTPTYKEAFDAGWAAGKPTMIEDPDEPETWTCYHCGSSRWVGWAAGPGRLRKAQCVPCGWVGDMHGGHERTEGTR